MLKGGASLDLNAVSIAYIKLNRLTCAFNSFLPKHQGEAKAVPMDVGRHLAQSGGAQQVGNLQSAIGQGFGKRKGNSTMFQY